VASILITGVPTVTSVAFHSMSEDRHPPQPGIASVWVSSSSGVVVTRGCSFVAMLISPIVWFRAPSDVVSEPAVVVELREQLLVWGRGLDEREDALLAREHGIVEDQHALGIAHVECDAVHDQATTIREDHRARVCASTTGRRRSLEFDQVLSGC
jgi:hypothetical protein